MCYRPWRSHNPNPLTSGIFLRVIHLGKYYPPASGGIETHTQALARGLAQLGLQVEVVVVNHQARNGQDVTFERFAETPDAEDYDGSIRIHRVSRKANIAKLDVSIGLLSKIRELLKNPPDVWHLHTPNITMMLAVLANPRIRPLVITHHSDIVKQVLLYKLIRPVEKILYQRAAHLLSDSPPYIDGSNLLKQFQHKVSSLPLGIDIGQYKLTTSEAHAHAAELHEQCAGPVWVSVGRLIYYKALDIAISALRNVPGTLHVIGTGPMEQAWKAKAAELGVANRIRWRGRASQTELAGTYLAATAHWFPSNARSEGFGLVQVEAMASGCPTINAQIPHSGVPWVCRHELEGLTVPPNDVQAFASAARRLLEEPDLRSRLAANGRKRADEEFEQAVMSQRCLEIYHQVLGNKSRR